MSMKASIRAIEYSLPERVLTNSELAAEFPDWSVDKIESKTGISARHIAADGQCSSDLGVEAARKLFARHSIDPAVIDYVLFCTQSPDYFLPASACVIQQRLGLRVDVGAIDINQGCSGYVYGLSLAKGLIETGQALRVLLITAETYSKFIHPSDKSVRTLFGDAGAATLVEAVPTEGELIGPFIFGTDGSRAEMLIVPQGGCRAPLTGTAPVEITDKSGNVRTTANLFMDGAGIFQFTLTKVPEAVAALLKRTGATMDSVDRFVFHQANKFMLDALKRKLAVDQERFLEYYRDVGNTVSCTIPIVLAEAHSRGQIPHGSSVMLVGFGVGLSWSACMMRWSPGHG